MISKEQFVKDFRELLSVSGEITMDTDLLDINEWDSFSAMSFITMIENKYKVEVEPFFIAEAVLLEDLYNIVSEYTNKGGSDV